MMTEQSLFIVSAPSGAGKTSLVKALVQEDPRLTVTVSHTTRKIRKGEQEGVHYHFVEQDDFVRMIGEGAFLEHARVFDHYYGTSEQAVREQWKKGKDVILEIDWQGARQVRKRFPSAVSIFVLPPSKEVLQDRLEDRGQDSASVIGRRMRDAVDEMSHFAEFDFIVVNDDFDEALGELTCILSAQRSRVSVQAERLNGLIGALLGGS